MSRYGVRSRSVRSELTESDTYQLSEVKSELLGSQVPVVCVIQGSGVNTEQSGVRHWLSLIRGVMLYVRCGT